MDMNLRPRLSFFRDWVFQLALLLGPLLWLILWQLDLQLFELPAAGRQMGQFFLIVLLYPLLEELTFRGAIQSSLLHFASARCRYFGLSGANLVTSCLFAVFHLINHPVFFASLVFFPSLVFGGLRDRYRSTLPAILLHSFYNLGFYLLVSFR